jgi:sulfatase maturation enzyme AslB (radical SAM superfamily)
LKSFFKKEELSRIKYLFFQGNLGDPILHPNFHEISEYFFDVQHLSVITNGIQSPQFWSQVLETWPKNSLITLSIDGLEDTNSIYRVGAPWTKIQFLFDLIHKTKRKCKVEWKFLVFEHNRHQIETASKLADQLGIDSFRIQQSRSLNLNTNLNGKIREVKFNEQEPVASKEDNFQKLLFLSVRLLIFTISMPMGIIILVVGGPVAMETSI